MHTKLVLNIAVLIPNIRKMDDSPLVICKTDKQIFGTFFGIAWIPDNVDLHGEYASSETIENAAHDFVKNYRVIGIDHKYQADARLVECYIAPDDLEIHGQFVKKGSLCLVVEVTDKALWDEVKSGKYKGLSPSGIAHRAR